MPLNTKILIPVIVVVVVVIGVVAFMFMPRGGASETTTSSPTTQTSSPQGGPTGNQNKTTAVKPEYNVRATITYREARPSEQQQGKLAKITVKVEVEVTQGYVKIVEINVDNLSSTHPLHKYLSYRAGVPLMVSAPNTWRKTFTAWITTDHANLKDSFGPSTQHYVVVKLIVENKEVVVNVPVLISPEMSITPPGQIM